MASGMSIAHNLGAMKATRQLTLNSQALRTSLERLSSGHRINTGADAPADLIISEQLRAQNVGLQRAVRNTNEAMNVLGIAEGALNEMSAILKKMRELALHAANDGITSPQQVAADQAELDSGVQTIDRIAQTTRYSDQFLLNGGKAILFDRDVERGNGLLDLGFSRIDQVFKRGAVADLRYAGPLVDGDESIFQTQATKGYVEAGATSGSRGQIDHTDNTVTSDQRFTVTGADGSREFSFSRGSSLASIAEAINNVSGSTGVQAELVLASTGITSRTRQALNPNTSGTGSTTAADNAVPPVDMVRGDLAGGPPRPALLFNRQNANDITNVDFLTDVVLGKHTDGHGRVFARWTGTPGAEATLSFYKAAADENNEYDEADLVGQATVDLALGGSIVIEERNNSGLSADVSVLGAGFVDANGDGIGDNDIVIVTHGVDRYDSAEAAQVRMGFGETAAELLLNAVTSGSTGNDISIELIDPGQANQTASVSVKGSRIRITLATDANGDVTTVVSDGADAAGADTLRALIQDSTAASALVNLVGVGIATTQTVSARGPTYLSGGMDADRGIQITGDEDAFSSVTVSGVELGQNTDSEGKLYIRVSDADGDGFGDTVQAFKDSSMSAESLVAGYYGVNSGAAGALLGPDRPVGLEAENGSGLRMMAYITVANVELGDSVFEFETGIRLSSSEYGDKGFVRVQASEGALWDVYDADNAEADDKGFVNLDATDGPVTLENRGHGASLSLNGGAIFTQGLTAEVARPDFNGHLAFQEGEVGATTIAQVGYDKGFTTTAIGQLAQSSNYAVNAGVVNEDRLDNFQNGMQLQLGEGAGDQERVILGIQSMTAANLGRVRFSDDFSGDGALEEKVLGLSDMLGGGLASLSVDPIRSLRIIDQAVDDVAGLRARLGATQANLLQTNANNLQVAIENITKTESAIRDTDMAMETSAFTKNQIMTQAATSMVAQANAAQRNVLSLLQF